MLAVHHPRVAAGGPLDLLAARSSPLPAPKSRSKTSRGLVSAVAGWFSLRHDIAYFFSAADTVDLGDATEIDPATLRTNQHVRVAGTEAPIPWQPR